MQDFTPEVDIIIPAYNAARFLPAAIESVKAQTLANWRIILVDDGSTDSTSELAVHYQNEFGPKLKYIWQSNAGLPAARNTAIANSTAEFLALLDADDIWLPQRLERSVESFRNRPGAGLSYGFNARIDTSGRVLDAFTSRDKHAEGWIASFIYMRMLDLPCPTITFRRSCVEEVGNFDENLRATEDRDLWLRIAQRFEVVLIPEVIAHYRVSPEAMTTDPDRMLHSQLQFIQKHYGSAGCGRSARRVAMASIYRQRAEALANRGSMLGALGSGLRAFMYCPSQFSNVRTAGSLLLRYSGLGQRS